MTKYVLAYHGGEGEMPSDPAEVQKVMEQWGAWYGSMGAAVVDGGAPFSVSKTVSAGGKVSDGNTKGLTGYTIIDVGGIDGAAEHAKGCPVLGGGGTVEVYECVDMGG